VRSVKDHLVAGISVNGAHDSALDGSIIIECLSHRSKAVGGAGCSGDDLVILGEGLLIYGVNDSGEIVACGSRNNDLLSACIDVSLALLLGAVEACALENNVNTESAPRAVYSVLLSVDLESLAVNSDGACLVICGNGVKILADDAAVALLSGVILEEMSEHGGLGKVVDGNYLIAGSVKHLTECETADAAETIDCNFY
jgi:hypothetical protein